ncbi:ATP-dependent DNA helicase RecG [Haloechinothrix alba]|uniref:ATP-dependent DNA helicase RecG n=1 Tax=Haloechinothrix alba TaxID=664784 RepID=A0A238WJN0_9PSEU|nr:ATP-binding protein [Haloechinothrix alba]SNR46760.1 ATP-dependent DNA helicase RecG [Haloechinothrix alba]
MSSNEVDHILHHAAQSDVGQQLLAAPENQWFDRKSVRINAKDLARTLIAFANAEGGTVVVGLRDGHVEGLHGHVSKVNALRQACMDHAVPPVRSSAEEVSCVNEAGENDTLLVIRVPPGERVHETPSGDCYLRSGDESRKLSFHQRQELEFDKGQAQYDGFAAAGVDLTDLDSTLLEQYRTSAGAEILDRLLHARSLLTREGHVTNAAYLLFATHPQHLFPQAFIRVLRFTSTERGTGARFTLDEEADLRIEGPLPRAINDAREAIERYAPRRRALDEYGRFTGHDLVPRQAWLEGLVNAAIHRSYSLAGDHIRVEIYPDRIEIESPGRFPGLADPSKPLEISRFARNPRIARVCADLRIGQEFGEGIKRIFDEMRRVGLRDPIYTQTSGSVRLKLAAVSRLDPELAARLPHGAQAVLDLLRATDRPLGTGDIADSLDLSRPTAIARLRALHDEGLVSWNGRSAKDPRATWAIAVE